MSNETNRVDEKVLDAAHTSEKGRSPLKLPDAAFELMQQSLVKPAANDEHNLVSKPEKVATEGIPVESGGKSLPEKPLKPNVPSDSDAESASPDSDASDPEESLDLDPMEPIPDDGKPPLQVIGEHLKSKDGKALTEEEQIKQVKQDAVDKLNKTAEETLKKQEETIPVVPGRSDVRPEGDTRSAEQILKESPLLRNLGDQDHVDDKLKKIVGDYHTDADAAYRAVKILEYIEKVDRDGKPAHHKGDMNEIGNNKVDGYTKDGEARHDSEAGRLQDFTRTGNYDLLVDGGTKKPELKTIENLTAEDIQNQNPVLKNLPREGDVRVQLKEEVGDFDTDPDAASRAVAVLNYIKSSKDADGHDRESGIVGNGVIEGYDQQGNSRAGTEAGKLDAFLSYGAGALNENHQLDPKPIVNSFGPNQTRPEDFHFSAQEIIDKNDILKNLGNQDGVKDALKKQVGDFEHDADAAYRAVEVLNHIEQFDANGKDISGPGSPAGNGTIDGFYGKSGEVAQPNTEASRLQEFGKSGYQSLKGGNNTADDVASGTALLGGAGAGNTVNSLFPNAGRGTDGKMGVDPAVAEAILQNISEGKPPIRPEMGNVGNVSWFVTEGEPHTGIGGGKVGFPVEVKNTSGKPPVEFNEAKLTEIYDKKLPEARITAERSLRLATNKGPNDNLSNKNKKTIEHNAKKIAERQMWTEVGETVKSSESGFGKVKLENSRFSKNNGEFTLTSKSENIKLGKGAVQTMLDSIQKGNPAEERGLFEAAEKLAKEEKWAGKVKGAFSVGGKILIVVGLAADGYRIYTSENKAKTTAEVAGGWGGAAAAGALFSTAAAPLLALGPIGIALYAGGSLFAGAAGYFAGSKLAGALYELIGSKKHVDFNG